MAQSTAKKVYLDDSGEVIKDVPDESMYDYASALKAGAQPDASGHWPSEFKKPGHPNEFVGGYSTITGEPNPDMEQEINPERLKELGWNTPPNIKPKKVYLDDSGEPISNEPNEPDNTTSVVPEDAPDTFSEGFINSIMGGEAFDAGMQGAKGFVKGAVADLPESIINAISGAPGLMKDSMGPLGDMIFGGNSAESIGNRIKSIPPALQEMYNTTVGAGAQPEAFGRMMGNVTGQPLATAGLVKASPSMVRGAGAVTEGTGKIMKNYQPASGMLPRILENRTMRNIERGVGKGIENVGQRMRQVGKSGKVNEPNIPEASSLVDDIVPEEFELPKPSKSTKKPKVRLNPDGTYTNLDTGEVFDSTGKPMATPIDKDSDFFRRNRKPKKSDSSKSTNH